MPIEPNNNDLINLIDNSFNSFKNALLLLRDNYIHELNLQKKYIIIYFIIISIIVFIIFIMMSFFMIFSFISAAKRRINYIEVFYGINDNSIKNLISNCEVLMNNLKKNGDNYNEDNIDGEQSTIQNKKQNEISRNVSLIKNPEKKNKTKISLNSQLFVVFYIIFMILMYIYFPYNGFLILNLSQKSIDYSIFLSRMNDFQSNMFDIFNIYREYLFYNESSFKKKDLFKYLMNKENDVYETMSDEIKYIEKFIAENIPMDEGMVSLFSRHLCSFYITDYFNSDEECKEKFVNIINYDFSILSSIYLQKLRNAKNIARYKQKTEYIDNLQLYNLELWRLSLFNNEVIHSELNLMIINIFYYYLDETRKEIIKRITLEGKNNLFILLFCLIIVFITLMYIIYLFPMIRYLNNFIYKTKNMLLLIPMTILTSQSNIKTLLNLSS